MASPQVTQPAFYRAFQFFVALKAYLPIWAGGGLNPADEALVTAVLTTPQRWLFARMLPNDQRHAVAVANTLRQAGYGELALLQAALLHDVGKSMGQPIIHRVLIVLLKAFWPSALYRLGQPSVPTSSFIPLRDPSSFPWWRRPFIIHAQHPAIGAAWAAEVGCEPLAVELIARHQDILSNEPVAETEKLLAALQRADNLN
jgi:hypothetical protein